MPRTTTTTAARPIVRELAGQAPRLDVVFDARTAFDFLVSIVGHGEKEHETDLLARDAAWQDRTAASLPPEQPADVAAFICDPSLCLPYSLPGLVIENPQVTDATSLVELLHSMSTEKLASRLIAGMLSKYNTKDLSGD